MKSPYQYGYFFIFIILLNVCDGKKTYYEYTLFRVTPSNDSHIQFLSNLSLFYDASFWKPVGDVKTPVDIMINPLDKPAFVKGSRRLGLDVTTVIDDVQKALDQQVVNSYIRRNIGSFNWDRYYGLNDIYQWLRDLARSRPVEMELEDIGISHENRNIMAVRITLGGTPKDKSIMIEGGIHGREWISPAFVTYLIHNILHANESEHKGLSEVANLYEWFIVPVLNVDGYEYSHTTDRLWRKNRNGNGVDLNRNFAFMFGSAGISTDTKDLIYPGNSSFSEKESQAMAGYVKDNHDGLTYYVAIHSYGPNMIIPYGHSKSHEDNFKEVYNMCMRAAAKIANYRGTKYEIGTAFETLRYETSGMSGCWVKNTYQVPYVVFIQMSNVYDGFAPPVEKILPMCKETLEGLVVFFTPKDKELDESDPFAVKLDDGETARMRSLRNTKNRANKVSGYIVLILCHFIIITVFFY